MAISSVANQIIVSRSILPVFLRKNHLPLHVMPREYKGGCVGDFLGCYLQSKIDVNKLFDNPSDG